MDRRPWCLMFLCAGFAWTAKAATNHPPVEFLESRSSTYAPRDKIVSTVAELFAGQPYRAIRVQVIDDHLLVYLHDPSHHRVDFAKVDVDPAFNVRGITRGYQLQAADFAQQPGSAALAACPDPSVEFIAFAPNDWDLEQQITTEVADAAQAKGLHVVRLQKDKATRSAYLAYMACPKLRGNFYDGDATPLAITTADGLIGAFAFDFTLRNQFQHRVTNIWLACFAYNDPIRSAVMDGAQSRKYAAGYNSLHVGPSDRAAACAMEAALDGKPMTASFEDCRQRLDIAEDHWGFGGDGPDDFWE